MRGLKLNLNLLQVKAVFVRDAFTEQCYHLWSSGDQHLDMLLYEGGKAIAVEVWAIPQRA